MGDWTWYDDDDDDDVSSAVGDSSRELDAVGATSSAFWCVRSDNGETSGSK